jgi:hypothetical protein
MRTKPKTEYEWMLYRAEASCRIGKESLSGKGIPSDLNKSEYALFNLLCAIEEIAKAMKSIKI